MSWWEVLFHTGLALSLAAVTKIPRQFWSEHTGGLFQTQSAVPKLSYHSYFECCALHMRREGTSAPEFPSSPFRRPSLPFPELSKYASGTPDRWTLISLAIWPQFVFLANEADYWAGCLMALKSTGFAPAVRGHLNFCREIRIITGIEIAPDATHSVHKCTNIITDNACRCFQSAFNSFDTTDWGVARRATTVQLQFSVLGDPAVISCYHWEQGGDFRGRH